MPRKPQPWFRFYVESFGDRKLRRLTPGQRWAWAAVLGAARESPKPGLLYVADELPMTVDELADYAGVPVRDARVVLDQGVAMNMLTIDPAGLVAVTNWGKRQFETTDNTTARTRTYRERSKERAHEHDGNVPTNVPGNVTDSSVGTSFSRARATETETETEQPELTKEGGQRSETLRATPATSPPPRCTRHPHGTDQPCRTCAAVREWDERHAKDAQTAAADRARNCPDCNGTGWLEQPDTGLPTARCTHRRTA